jgi:hypothetical protein
MRIFTLIVAGLFLFASARGNELFQSAPLDQVSVRTLPAFTVIETETTGTLDASWTKGFRLGARYVALSQTSLNTPTIITFPDWEKSPTAEGDKVHVLIQLMLDPIPNLPKVHDLDAEVEPMSGMTVACYAQSGAYTPAAFALGLKKIQDHLKAEGIAAIGPPRYLYYSTTNWTPSMWRVSEVQVPIAAGSGRNQ